MPATVIQIDQAEVRFGDVADPILPAGLTDYSCQVTRAEITSTANTTTTAVPATFCQAASEVNVPVASTFQLNLEGLQDWTAAALASLSAFLFEHDATKKAFALYLNGSANPVATGIVIIQAGGFGGAPGEPLVFSVTLNIDGYPDIKDSAGVSIRGGAAATATTTTTKGKQTVDA
jgi:hypothetical protein